MNTLDDLLAETGRVEGLAATAVERGRAQLDDALRSLHASPAAAGSTPRSLRRTVGFSLVSAAGIAAAVAAVVALTPTPGRSGDAANAPDGKGVGNDVSTASPHGSQLPANSITLAGYRITLPASYKIGATGSAGTNCTADLNLTADETKRLITTPTPGCPLLIASVQRTLPAGVDEFSVGQGDHAGNIVASFIGYQDWKAGRTYLPVTLPDGTTVYVTLRGSTVSSGQADVGLNGGYYSVTQLEQFERGVRITPSSDLPSLPPPSPADKPTVNCDADCGH